MLGKLEKLASDKDSIAISHAIPLFHWVIFPIYLGGKYGRNRQRNDNGEIDDGSELFGNATLLLSGGIATHGFTALAEFDLPEYGGNNDGMISKEDELFDRLALWTDKNHDGDADKKEIKKLKREVEAIDLVYEFDLQVDAHGNVIPFHSLAILKGKSKKSKKSGKGNDPVAIDVVDVYFVN